MGLGLGRRVRLEIQKLLASHESPGSPGISLLLWGGDNKVKAYG